MKAHRLSSTGGSRERRRRQGKEQYHGRAKLRPIDNSRGRNLKGLRADVRPEPARVPAVRRYYIGLVHSGLSSSAAGHRFLISVTDL